jgi:ketosteroid isomerase-like protein
MSQANVELIHRAYDAFNRHDLDAFLALMDADVQAVPLAAAIEGDYRGHDGIRRWWNNLFDAFPDWTIEVVEVRDLGDLTLAHMRNRGHGAGSDAPFELTLWQVVEGRDAKAVWWSHHRTETEALEAVRLRKTRVRPT